MSEKLNYCYPLQFDLKNIGINKINSSQVGEGTSKVTIVNEIYMLNQYLQNNNGDINYLCLN